MRCAQGWPGRGCRQRWSAGLLGRNAEEACRGQDDSSCHRRAVQARPDKIRAQEKTSDLRPPGRGWEQSEQMEEVGQGLGHLRAFEGLWEKGQHPGGVETAEEGAGGPQA